MSPWIYSKDGRNVGPLNSKKIANKVLEQELELDDYVLCTKTQLWKRIREIKEIMDLVHSPVQGRYFKDIDIQQFEDELGIQMMNEQKPFLHFTVAELIFWQFITLGMFGSYWLVIQNRYLYQMVYPDSSKYKSLKRFVLGPIHPILSVIQGIENHKTLNQALVPSNSLVGIFVLWTILVLTALLMVFITLTSLIFHTLFAASISFMVVMIPTQLYINHCHKKLNIPRTKRTIGFYLWMIFLTTVAWLFLIFMMRL
ncbi:MAG TPA: hypothetical protein PL126_05055 [Candidatus Cloacimonadota bacterium]|nr:hypothetical protein [Candidatus Cloacimonadota bacterium]